MDCDTLLDYPYLNEEKKIYTNASDFQLWEVISQNDKPIAVYSIKLTGAQTSYTVT